LSRVVPSLQRAILSLQLTMTISQVCYVYDRPLIRLAQGQPARGHCVRTLNGLLGYPQQSSLRPFPHKRGRKLWGLPLVTHGGSDPQYRTVPYHRTDNILRTKRSAESSQTSSYTFLKTSTDRMGGPRSPSNLVEEAVDHIFECSYIRRRTVNSAFSSLPVRLL
jgi:hypothetical protein